MVNGNDIVIFQEKNFKRLWNEFAENVLNDITMKDRDTDYLFKANPSLQIRFDDYCTEQFSQ